MAALVERFSPAIGWTMCNQSLSIHWPDICRRIAFNIDSFLLYMYSYSWTAKSESDWTEKSCRFGMLCCSKYYSLNSFCLGRFCLLVCFKGGSELCWRLAWGLLFFFFVVMIMSFAHNTRNPWPSEIPEVTLADLELQPAKFFVLATVMASPNKTPSAKQLAEAVCSLFACQNKFKPSYEL